MMISRGKVVFPATGCGKRAKMRAEKEKKGGKKADPAKK
jgi:hypothetical protein